MTMAFKAKNRGDQGMYGLATGSPRYDGKARNHHRYRECTSLHGLQNVPKPVRLLFITIISLCAFAGFLQGRSNYLDQLKKSHPTDFSRLHALNDSLWSPTHPVRYNHGSHIDDDYTYVAPLGQGQEGAVAVYKDGEGASVAVKTFSLVARNDIPAELVGEFIEFTTTWPSEIEAGLLLNKLGDASYVPVLDYFLLQDTAGWSWALVSPLVTGGTLLNLAQRERVAIISSTPNALDDVYRWSLQRLLLALEDLHASGLCHDDIKPDNVFIGNDPSHWMLGDLGNVREVKHPWHNTASWTRQNQLTDCKTNDVKRMLKTYLSFMRAASYDSDEFDRQFWSGQSAWSRMYWDFTKHPIDAGRLFRMSDLLYSHDGSDIPGGVAGGVESQSGLREATERELTCTTLPRRLWFAKSPRA